MKTSEVLRAAKGLIEDPADWCGNGWERDGRRCMLHALHTIRDQDLLHLGETATTPEYHALVSATGVPLDGVGGFNDSHSHAEVMAAFDRAIALVEAPELTFPSEWTRTEVPA